MSDFGGDRGESRLALPRRDLLKLVGSSAVATGGVGSGLVERAGAAPSGQDSLQGSDWTATHKDAFRSFHGAGSGEEYYHYVFTSHVLDYMGAIWDPYTVLCDGNQGAWQHTFVLSNVGYGFTNHRRNEATTGTFAFNGSGFELSAPEDADIDCMAWAPRHDMDTYFFLNPGGYESLVYDDPELLDLIESDIAGEIDLTADAEDRAPTAPQWSLDEFLEEGWADTIAEAGIKMAGGYAAGKTLERLYGTKGSIVGEFLFDLVLELTLDVDFQALLGTKNVIDMYEGITDGYSPSFNAYDPVAPTGLEVPSKHPASGMALVFDVYVAPDEEGRFDLRSELRNVGLDNEMHCDKDGEIAPCKTQNENFDEKVDEALLKPEWGVRLPSMEAPDDNEGRLPRRTTPEVWAKADGQDPVPAYRDIELDPTFEVDWPRGYPNYEFFFDASNSNFMKYDYPETHDIYWDFGAGQPKDTPDDGDDAIISHDFGESGIYDVELRVQLEDGTKSATATKTVQVDSHPSIWVNTAEPVGLGDPVEFRIDAGSFHQAQGPEEADFFDFQYEWEFDDGNTSDVMQPTHEYDTLPDETQIVDGQEVGTYEVGLKVLVTTADQPDSQGPHLVKRQDGDEYTATYEIEVSEFGTQLPDIAIDGPDRAVLDEPTQYELVVLSDPENQIDSVYWEVNGVRWDDGSTFTHEFTRDGTNTVTVNAVVEGVTTVSESMEVEVLPFEPPTIQLQGPSEVSLDDPTDFSVQTDDPDGAIEEIRWDLDGVWTGATGQTWTHSFQTLGTHDVTVRALSDTQDPDAYTATDSITVEVLDYTPPELTIDGSTEATTQQYETYSADLTDPDDVVKTLRWRVDGDIKDTGPEYTHLFASTGTHTVTVEGIDGDRVYASASLEVTVVGEPSLSVSRDWDYPDSKAVEQVRLNYSVSVTDPTDALDTVEWYVDGSLVGTGRSLEYEFSSTGDYTVRAEATWGGGTVSDSITETVYRRPTIDIDGPTLVHPTATESYTVSTDDPANAISFIEWYLDGVYQTLGDSFEWSSDGRSTGTHTIQANATYFGATTGVGMTVDVYEIPTVTILGSQSTYVGFPETYEADISDPDNVVTSIEWFAQQAGGSTPDMGSGTTFETSWSAYGTYTVGVWVYYDDGDYNVYEEISVDVRQLDVT